MPNDNVQRLLEAEQRARELADILDRLVKEIESYRSAQQELRKTADGLSMAATGLGELASQAAGVINTLKHVGTPEILDRLAQVEGMVRGLPGVFGERLEDVKNRIALNQDGIEIVGHTLEDTSKNVGDLRSRIDRGFGPLAEAVAGVRSDVAGLRKMALDESKKSADALREASVAAVGQHEVFMQRLGRVEKVVLALGAALLVGLALVGWLVAR